MHPGQQTEQERLLENYQQLSAKIAQVELEFNQAGVMFFILTVIDDRDLGVDSEEFSKAFHADTSNTFVPKIHRVRQLREQAQAFLRNDDYAGAANNLDQLDDDLDNLAEAIIVLEMHVRSLGSHMTIDCTKDSLLLWSTQEDKRALSRHPRFREWVLNLTEIEHALALGILENANQAVSSILEIEDCLI